MTREPVWFQRESCCEMVVSWSIRASIWAGPYRSLSFGNANSMRVPAAGPSQRAASHAIMLSRLFGTIGSIRMNSSRASPGSRMTV